MHNINFEYCYYCKLFLLYSYLYHIYFLLFQFYLKISISLVKKERRKRIDEELFVSKVFQMGEIQLKLAKKKKKLEWFYSQSMELTRGDRKP